MRATSGSDYKGDISIDDIYVYKGNCSRDRPIEISRCSFEIDICGYKLSTDNAIWGFRRKSGRTPSTGTGPQYSFDGSKNTKIKSHVFLLIYFFFLQKVYYLYSEAKRAEFSSVSLMTTTTFNTDKVSCISFYYHMLASKLYIAGVLFVYLQYNGENHFVVSEKGNKGYSWINQEIETSFKSFKIVFKAIRGSIFESDIAIDFIELNKKACKSKDKTVYPTKNMGIIHKIYVI